MRTRPKPVDLKALLDKIEKLAATSPEIGKDLLMEFQAYSDHLRQVDRKAFTHKSSSLIGRHPTEANPRF